MAKSNQLVDNDSVGSCEDEEMMVYRKKCLSVITFRIVHAAADLDSPHKPTNSFKPDMAHQIFGETEMIFGYKQLSITLYYLHNSAKCFVDLRARDPIPGDVYKPDDVMKLLEPWLPEKFRETKADFLEDVLAEKHDVMYGKVLSTFKQENNVYKITECDSSDPEFRTFHERFQTYIYWFIDGANSIDLADKRWMIYYVFEEQSDTKSSTLVRSPVGFCTVYKFFLYPNNTRPRISQFFVLPTHQKRGIGTKLYASVYEHLKELPESVDITVEEPTEIFQKMRDLADCIYIHNDLKANKININTQNQKQMNAYLKKHKMCKKQAQRVFDILESVAAHQNGHGEYKKFANSIRQRIEDKIKRETQGSKRLCNYDGTGLGADQLDREATMKSEYVKYIDSLDWPVNRLLAHLGKNAQ